MKLKKIAAVALGLTMAFSTCAAGTLAEEHVKTDFAPETLAGGWSLAQDNLKEAHGAFAKALENLTGCDYELVAYLGSQVVAGTHYAFLCKYTPVAPHAKSQYSVLYVYENLDGAAEIVRMEDIALDASANQINDSDAFDTNVYSLTDDDGIGTPNPFAEVSTLNEAAEIAGFALAVPDAPESHPNRVIRATDGMIEILYLNTTAEEDESFEEAYRIRKAIGSEDISGDYHDYDNIQTEAIGKTNVTLKGNGSVWSVIIWTEGAYTYAIDAQEHPLTMQAVSLLMKAIH